jgi:hypothetical protein
MNGKRLFRGWRRDRESGDPPVQTGAVPLPNGWRIEVPGSAHYQEQLSQVLGCASHNPPEDLETPHAFEHLDQQAVAWFRASLVLDGPVHDPASVAVWCECGIPVGSLDTHQSGAFSRVLREYVFPRGGRVGACPAYVYQRAPDDPTLGVRLCCLPPGYLVDLGRRGSDGNV